MPRKKKEHDHVPPLVTDRYAALLRAKKESLEDKDLEDAAAVTRMTFWRGSAPDQSRGKRTLGGAYALRYAIKALTGEDLPPPVVPIEDQLDYEWYLLGQRLKAAEGDHFYQAMTNAERELHIAESMSKLASLTHPTESAADDIPPRWTGTKGTTSRAGSTSAPGSGAATRGATKRSSDS